MDRGKLCRILPLDDMQFLCNSSINSQSYFLFNSFLYADFLLLAPYSSNFVHKECCIRNDYIVEIQNLILETVTSIILNTVSYVVKSQPVKENDLYLINIIACSLSCTKYGWRW